MVQFHHLSLYHCKYSNQMSSALPRANVSEIRRLIPGHLHFLGYQYLLCFFLLQALANTPIIEAVTRDRDASLQGMARTSPYLLQVV